MINNFHRLKRSSLVSIFSWIVFFLFACKGASGDGFFGTTTLTFSGSSQPGVPVDITLTTQVLGTVWPDYRIALVLPRFTQRLTQTNQTYTNISASSLLIAPSLLFEAEWLEPDFVSNYNENQFPYPNSVLLIRAKNNATIGSGSALSIKVYRENGIGPLCGFPSNTIQNISGNVYTPTPDFRIVLVEPLIHYYNETVTIQNYTFSNSGQFLHHSNYTKNETFSEFVNRFYSFATSRVVDTYNGLGDGCTNLLSCSNAGICDFCFQKCHCFPGRGASTDIMTVGMASSIDCSIHVCPAGRAIGFIASSETQAHPMLECSNAGLCNTNTGICSCFAPFTGSACEKRRCPNDCSGNGECLSMRDLARTASINLPEQYAVTYGTALHMDDTAWDYQTMRGCVCSSSWTVGFDAGETQLPEYFGGDCSLRHCPSGDDPFTAEDETNCHRRSQVNAVQGPFGQPGNKCHVDCSNRGTCDYSTGKCQCYEGSYGEACDRIAHSGREF